MPYLHFGAGSGLPVVLLPGLSDGLAPLTRGSAPRLVEELPLPAHRFPMLAISYRRRLGRAVDTRRLAADVAALLGVRLDRPAVVVGHSMGGMVAQHLAADHPELVAAVVISASSARADQRIRAVLARWDVLLTAGHHAAFSRDAVSSSFTGEYLTERLRRLCEDPPSTPTARAVRRHLRLAKACAGHDADDRLARVRCPVLVLAASEDRVMSVEHGRRLAAGLTDARYVELAGLGHGFPDQDPDGYARHVVPFLERVV